MTNTLPVSARPTQRNPEMEIYTAIQPVIVPGEPKAQIVWLKAGSQSFRINDYYEDLEHAEWMRDMLCIALAKIVAAEALSANTIVTDEIASLRAENERFRRALFGANVTPPEGDLSTSRGPKEPANGET